MQKRILSVLLCMTMLFGFIPAGALAENYKVCEASNPQGKTSYCRNDGVKILIT